MMFTKNDLKDWDIVVLRNGERYVVNLENESIMNGEDFKYLVDYTYTLERFGSINKDIISVHRGAKLFSFRGINTVNLSDCDLMYKRGEKDEVNMKKHDLTISDIVWEDGREYSIMFHDEDLIEAIITLGDFKIAKGDCKDELITDYYSLDEIVGARFRESIDWSKVPVDTKVLVKSRQEDSWKKAYFAKFKDGKFYCFISGKNSWSVEYPDDIYGWSYAKLAEEE